jgi:hypothetical protein
MLVGNATAAFADRCVIPYTVTLPEFDANHTQYSQAAFNLTIVYEDATRRVGEPFYPVVVRRQIGELAPAQVSSTLPTPLSHISCEPG